jgi:hypothetical protein
MAANDNRFPVPGIKEVQPGIADRSVTPVDFLNRSFNFQANQAGAAVGANQNGISVISGNPFLIERVKQNYLTGLQFTEGQIGGTVNNSLWTINAFLQLYAIINPYINITGTAGQLTGRTFDVWSLDGSSQAKLDSFPLANYQTDQSQNTAAITIPEAEFSFGGDVAVVLLMPQNFSSIATVVIKNTRPVGRAIGVRTILGS